MTLILFIVLVLAIPHPVMAQKQIPTYFYLRAPQWLQQCFLAGPGPQGQFCNLTPSQLVSLLLPNILILAGIIFFFLILGGGFMLIHGAGKESSPQDKAKAQGAVTFGLIGFLLVVGAYFILQMIEVITGVQFINPPTI